MKTLVALSAFAVAAMTVGAAAAAPGPSAADVAHGKTLFNAQCSLCHSAQAGVEGAAPSLYGVLGRKAGSDPGYTAYTPAIKKAGQVWTPANLDKFLSNPAATVPGTAMPISVASPVDRHHLIAYLASLKAGR